MSLSVYLMKRIPCEVYYDNITSNLLPMVKDAGIYQALWRPEELGITKAKQLIPILERGLEALRSDPPKYKAMNPKNGWGSYEGLLTFVEQYLAACKEHPTAKVEVSR